MNRGIKTANIQNQSLSRFDTGNGTKGSDLAKVGQGKSAVSYVISEYSMGWELGTWDR